MAGELRNEVKLAARALARRPGFAVPALIASAFAVGLGIAILGLVRVESMAPVRLRGALVLDSVRDAGWSFPLRSAARVQEAGLERALVILVGLALLALVIAGLNLTILTLMRATGRRREAAVRAALGEPRSRIWLRSAAEGLVLSAVGLVTGVVAGLVGGALVVASWPHGVTSLSRWIPPLWGLTIGVAVPAAALVLPPLSATLAALRRRDWARWLTVGERATGEPMERLRRSGLAVIQVAGTLALLVAAGLLVRGSLPGGTDGSLGYDPADTLLVELELGDTRGGGPGRLADEIEETLANVSNLADIDDAALSSPGSWIAIGAEGVATAECGDCYVGGLFVPVSPAVARHHAVSPRFFETMRSTVLHGREFAAEDDADAPLRAVVNRSFAEKHFEAGRAVGRRVQLGGGSGEWYEVIGVVEDIRGGTIGSAVRRAPVVYLSLLQRPVPSIDLLVRSTVAMDVLETPLADALARSDGVASHTVRGRLEQQLAYRAAPLRWLGYLFGALAVLALVIATYGLVAVMRYEVFQRRVEIATRAAVGATPGAIARLFVCRTLKLTTLGTALGALFALPLVGWLERVAPGLDPIDPVPVAVVVVSLVAATLAGSVGPALTASRLDPMRILRGG